MKKFLLYCTRWQLSTPILWGVLYFLPILGIQDKLVATIIANGIGAVGFFWVDKYIFKK
jgi:putative flippase GtrA